MIARRCPTVRNRPQPSATVRNRPQLSATVRAIPIWPCLWHYGKSCKRVTFGGFTNGVAWFRMAGVALRDIQTCFVTCRKSFCVAGAILLRRFHKMCCSFRGRCSTSDASIVILRGRRSTSDVSCCVFFPNTSQGFPFHSGGLGVEGAFARRCVYVRNRPQPSATVRNCSQPSA